MVFVSTKGQGLSVCYTMRSTVLLMLFIFVTKEALFLSKCSICNFYARDRISVYVNIDETRGLATHRGVGNSTKPNNTLDEDDTKITEAKLDNLDVSEDDLSDTHGTDEVKESVFEELLAGNATLVETTSNPEEGGDGEKNEGSSPAPPQRSVQYYAKEYNHSVAELRLLTAKDGAPPLHSNISPPEREITIVTQTSPDRLPALEVTCLVWGGAIVVAVHVRLQSDFASVYEQVKQMHARVEDQSGCRLEIQLVTEDGFETDEQALRALYPVNSLRNVALGMAKTKLVFLLDADFKPSPRLHESLTNDEATYQDLLRKITEERKLFVVPAFGTAIVYSRHTQRVTVPETMEELRKGWDDKAIDCFHCLRFPSGHMPTNFTKFFNPATTSPYRITYKDGFEPYVIGALDVIPPYDGRFRGYGMNKISHLYACAADGMDFVVLPNVFVFELPHPASQAREVFQDHKNRDSKNVVEGLYIRFQKEIEKEQLAKDRERYRQFLDSSRPHSRGNSSD